MVRHLLLTFAVVASLSATASANLIDFEDAAAYGGDNALADAYLANFGISIEAEAGWFGDNRVAEVQFERTGTDHSDAFISRNNPAGIDGGAFFGNAPALEQVGDYILKIGSGNLPFYNVDHFTVSISYDSAVASASAQIWDIDGTEQFSVVGYDAAGNVVASVDSPTGGLDGQGWTWSLEAADGFSISRVDIDLIGGGNVRGIAFDNFNSSASTHTVPIPAAFPMGCIGMAALAFKRRRRRTTDTLTP